jgi:hypothetical protein
MNNEQKTDSSEFWVIEYLNDEGNMIGYLEDVRRADGGGLDTYWTKDIYKALPFSSESSAQNELDGSVDHAIGDRSRFCKVRQHAWIKADPEPAESTDADGESE